MIEMLKATYLQHTLNNMTTTLTTTLTTPKKYISLIDRELRKDRLAPPTEKRDFMKFIPFLPAELRREIFKFIDIETRISMMLDKRPYLVRGTNRLPEETLNANGQNPFHSLLNNVNLTNIYLNGFVKQLFYYNETPGFASRRWYPKKELFNLFESDTQLISIQSSSGVDLRTEAKVITFNHTVLLMLDNFRKKYPVSNAGITARWDEVSSVPICALSLLLKTKYNMEIDYFIRKKGFKLMIATDCLIRKKKHLEFLKKQEARPRRERNEMYQEEMYTRRYNKRKLKADKKAAKVAKKAAIDANKAAIVVKKAAVAIAKAEKKAAKEIRNNEIFISKLMGFGSINM